MTPHPLGGINKKGDDREGIDESIFEDELVSYLLGRYGLRDSKWDILEAQKKSTGGYQLTLYQFQELFGSFPPYLVSTKIKGIAKDLTIRGLCQKFMARKIIKRYKELRETVPLEYRGKLYGMVFNYPYITRGLILHNGDSHHDGVKIVWSDGPKQLCIEPFDQFLDCLPEWRRE